MKSSLGRMFISYWIGSLKYGVSKRTLCLSSVFSSYHPYVLRHSKIFSSNDVNDVTQNKLNVTIIRSGESVVVKYVWKFFSHNSKSNPVRVYSARSPHVSKLVYNLKLSSLSSSHSFFTEVLSRSINLVFVPKLLFTLSSNQGIGSSSIFLSSFHVDVCIVGSPPVTRKIFKSLYISGHHSQNAST